MNEKKANDFGVEWVWSDAPILLPLAFEMRELNAVYTAFILAEYSGGTIVIFHVKTEVDEAGSASRVRSEVKRLGSRYGVKYEFVETEDLVGSSNIGEISDRIVMESVRAKAQAIVMSAYREKFMRELLGRISDRVTRKSTCRVVLVESPRVGVTIPQNPRKIMIPVLGDDIKPDPFILASAFTSSATPRDFEMVAARVVRIPPTLPLDAGQTAKVLKRFEVKFNHKLGSIIPLIGRVITPRRLAVRDVGEAVSDYATEMGADMLIIHSDKPGWIGATMTKDEYAIVKRAPCVTLVAFPV